MKQYPLVCLASLLILNACSTDDGVDESDSLGGEDGGTTAGDGDTGDDSSSGDGDASESDSGDGGSGAGAASGGASSGGTGAGTGGAVGDSTLSFFVSSTGFDDGSFGGISVADTRCQELAEAVGAGGKTWRAYLSAASDPGNGGEATNAAERIGSGPWVNANGVEVASSLSALHSRTGDVDVFVDENGERINGQWEDSPEPNEHDIITGSDSEGMSDGNDCNNWTEASGDVTVGHSDGLGPNMDDSAPRNSWHSAHQGRCGNFPATGGAGKVYCFAID